MAMLLLQENATVTVCHSRTRDLAAVCRSAEILVAAIGRTAMITADFIQPGAVVIDVGMNTVRTREEAERVAWSAPGVTHVEDSIVVSP